MASTSRYTGPDGKDYWEVRWHEGDKHPRTKTDDEKHRFRTERQARKYGESKELLHQRGEKPRMYDQDASLMLTVSQYAWHWCNSRYASTDAEDHTKRYRTPGSKKWTEGMIRNHIDGTSIADIRFTGLKESDVTRWVDQRSVYGGGTLANSTLKMAVGLLRAIYATGVSDGTIGSSPVPGNKKIHWPKPGEKTRHEKRPKPLTVEQVLDLADAFPARYRAMPLVQAGLGVRIGELLALRDVDICWGQSCDQPYRRSGFGEGGPHVHVDYQFNDTEKRRGPHDGGRSHPKSNPSVRAIPMDDEVANVLREHIAAFPPGEDGSLFTSVKTRRQHASGGPIGHQYYGQQLFKRAVEKAGLPKCTTHALRHHYASVLLDAGLTHEQVAERLGHADAGLVISTYGHAMPGGAEKARDAISEAWKEARTTRRHLRVV